METQIKEDTLEIKSSCLSKTLAEILKDNEALTYFVQYLETVGCGTMIKFLLDAESFNSVLLSSGTNSNGVSHTDSFSNLQNNSKSFIIKGQSKKVLLNCESKDCSKNGLATQNNGSDIGCDENSSLSTVTNENIKNKSEDVEEVDLINKLLNTGANSQCSADALKIFQKYFSHKAALKINLSMNVRKRLIENLKTSVNKDSFSEVKDYIFKIIEKE